MNKEWLWKTAGNSKYSSLLKQKFLEICPYGEEELKRLMTNGLLMTGLGSILAVLVLTIWNSCFENITWLYFAGSIAFALYLVAMELPGWLVQKKENNLYQEMIVYLSRVKHRYLSCRHIPNAVLLAADSMSYEIQRLAGELYRILMESDRKEKVREYVLYNPANRYLKLFLVQAYEASEKGDITGKEGTSLFSENAEYLRVEIMEELYRRKRMAYEFAGYIFVSAAPVFFMPVLKRWGLDFAPELDYFYAGVGQVLELLTIGSAFVIYGLINRAKEIAMFVHHKEQKSSFWDWLYHHPALHYPVRWLERKDGEFSRKIRELLLQAGERISFAQLWIKMIGIACCSLMAAIIFVSATHIREQKTVLESVSTIETIAPLATAERRKILEQQILHLVKQYKEEPEVSEEKLLEEIRTEIRSSNRTMEQAILEEIRTKLDQYQSAGITWMELFFCLLGSLLLGSIPLLKIWHQVQTSLGGAIYEVKQFQSVVIMERQLNGITILSLLEDMEIFSGLFKGVLRRCINSYSGGPALALQKMKEEGQKLHTSFAELADSFLSVDEVGVTLAFAEVENNRVLLEKMSRLETEISMEKKKDNTELLSKVPMVLAVGAYFVIPFFIYSLQGVYEVFVMLEELQM
ncbi:MAG: hypothetical protein J6A77_13275 [Lachnospiraceae bacterium]|nr:hypothetical protein [Lachnospiraceae bacterium]